ncbi:MAG TPA: hypothetical protein PK001_14880 [Dokdonella sp.]|uniref:hypothetical protein n=1 Tax=Dokdonella sp. TaxID=2291710 RepID=UPI002BB3CE92|nr:hypothetical protein [Dokdonella sp.]HOX73008.1 hypothetical protein [Dokdonella sp.]
MQRKFNDSQVHELLYQALETERGGIKIYTTALKAATNEDLHKEWTGYLDETRTHESVLTNVFAELGLDTEKQTPGRVVVAHIGDSLVKAIEMALRDGSPEAAQLVAGECVVLAETKDHLNWELIGHVANHASGDVAKVLRQAFEAVEKDEDHHLYHTTGWTRELWIDSLGFPAVLPPPEEVKKVETAIGASRAEQARESML